MTKPKTKQGKKEAKVLVKGWVVMDKKSGEVMSHIYPTRKECCYLKGWTFYPSAGLYLLGYKAIPVHVIEAKK